MSRNSRPGGPYVRPVKSDGTDAAAGGGRGMFTLAASTTYYAVLNPEDALVVGAHLTGYTAGLVLTSVTVEMCSHGKDEASDYDSTSGNWIPQNPPAAYVPVVGSGWTATAASVASTGSAVGGCWFDLSEMGARRCRLKIVVGSTGGDVRISTGGKQ